MAGPDSPRACVNCGDPVQGSGTVCAECTPVVPPGICICPYCKNGIPWERMRRYRRNHAEGSVEVLYYCPACRGIVEAACWKER